MPLNPRERQVLSNGTASVTITLKSVDPDTGAQTDIDYDPTSGADPATVIDEFKLTAVDAETGELWVQSGDLLNTFNGTDLVPASWAAVSGWYEHDDAGGRLTVLFNETDGRVRIYLHHDFLTIPASKDVARGDVRDILILVEAVFQNGFEFSDVVTVQAINNGREAISGI